MLSRPSSHHHHRWKRYQLWVRRHCSRTSIFLCATLVIVLLSLLFLITLPNAERIPIEIPSVTLPPLVPPNEGIGPPEAVTEGIAQIKPSTTTHQTPALLVATAKRHISLPSPFPAFVDDIPVIVFTFDRAADLRKTLESLFAVLPPSGHPIYVSQDGDHAGVAEVITSYGDRVTHLHYVWQGQPDPQYKTAYLKIAGHYEFALTQVFDKVTLNRPYQRVVMIEDDMQLAPDFFSYFRATAPLLEAALYRTDCFPGLGWMMSRSLWRELKPKWTWGFWDDWLREPPQRQGRSCVYPEINRVYTFGAVGSSGGQFYDQYLRPIQLNEKSVDWGRLPLGYLVQPSYDSYLSDLLANAVRTDSVGTAHADITSELDNGQTVETLPDRVVVYSDLSQLTVMINPLGLIPDHKAGVPRTSYKVKANTPPLHPMTSAIIPVLICDLCHVLLCCVSGHIALSLSRCSHLSYRGAERIVSGAETKPDINSSGAFCCIL